MKEKSLGILLGLFNVILLILCLVFFWGKDRISPVIKVEPVNYVYEEDLPEALLYQGVTAFDEKDGDVTNRIVIEKVVTDREQGTATITYGASDQSGNVGKVVRTLEMPVLTRIQFPSAGEAGIQASAQAKTKETLETEVMEEETEMSEGQEENGEETNDETEGMQTVGSIQDTGRPTMSFSSRELVVKVGETPEWRSVVAEASDDKDTKESLLESLEVQGEFHTETVGIYYVSLRVTDGDGQESSAYPLKLIVEE
ncbi:MAG: DUF5011 domain-containing protein [Lachnospiraceae bacterium]|nr:DUF5011 domain-containing protein [Lachnospiraceae bacterium]